MPSKLRPETETICDRAQLFFLGKETNEKGGDHAFHFLLGRGRVRAAVWGDHTHDHGDAGGWNHVRVDEAIRADDIVHFQLFEYERHAFE
jgi:hypothetical protein